MILLRISNPMHHLKRQLRQYLCRRVRASVASAHHLVTPPLQQTAKNANAASMCLMYLCRRVRASVASAYHLVTPPLQQTAKNAKTIEK